MKDIAPSPADDDDCQRCTFTEAALRLYLRLAMQPPLWAPFIEQRGTLTPRARDACRRIVETYTRTWEAHPLHPSARPRCEEGADVATGPPR